MSEDARRLTLGHRSRQQALRVATIRELSEVWRSTFDIDDVRGSWSRFATAALPAIEDGRRTSATLAAEHFSQFRETAGLGPRQATRMVETDERRARRALEYSSKVSTLRAIQAGRSPQEAARTGMVRSMGTSTRLVSEGGRDTLIQAVRDDPQARGWQRVTGGDPCEFCAMLSARGGVYSPDGADFEAHDHCACEAEPVYRTRFLDERQQQWKELYDREAKGQRDPLKAFRAAYRAEFKAA